MRTWGLTGASRALDHLSSAIISRPQFDSIPPLAHHSRSRIIPMSQFGPAVVNFPRCLKNIEQIVTNKKIF
jgi:hypothetical protein